MANYTVIEVAAMARVSVRTLHHYHEICLLDPACAGANGYRYNGRGFGDVRNNPSRNREFRP